jgi:hypothetical protein
MNQDNQRLQSPAWMIFIAKAVSVLFHPLFVGVMMAAYLIYGDPDLFTGFAEKDKMLKLMTVINNNVFFPLLVVVLLKALGFNKSIFLHTQKERIVPYIASITFFFWTYYIFKGQPEIPRTLVYMCRGLFFSASAALLLNNYFKISMHGMGVGGFMGLIVLLRVQGETIPIYMFILVLLLSAGVLQARKIVSDHQWGDLIVGFAVGFLSQLIVLWV